MCSSFFFFRFILNSGILTVGIMDCRDSVTVRILDCRDFGLPGFWDCRDFGVGIVDRRDCGCRDFWRIPLKLYDTILSLTRISSSHLGQPFSAIFAHFIVIGYNEKICFSQITRKNCIY